MSRNKLLAGAALAVLMFGASAPVLAKPSPPPTYPACVASPECSLTVDGNTVDYDTTGGTSGGGLTFVASFNTAQGTGQSPTTVSDDVLAFLNAAGDRGETYLGRAGNSPFSVGGDSITTSSTDGSADETGIFTYTPGTNQQNFVGEFVAIHAGSGQDVEIYQINTPGVTGTFATNDGHGLSNFDLFGMDPPAQTPVPEPFTLSLFGAGLAGAVAMRRRKARADSLPLSRGNRLLLRELFTSAAAGAIETIEQATRCAWCCTATVSGAQIGMGMFVVLEKASDEDLPAP